MDWVSYSDLMGENPAHIVLTIETSQPIEVVDFIGAFTSIAEEYRRHIQETQPGVTDEAKVYVKEVRTGSIIAELIPGFAIAAPFISDMEKILVVEEFVRTWGGRLTALISGDSANQPATKSELETFTDATAAIANDPNGSSRLEAAYFEDGERKIKAAFQFDTRQARVARSNIQLKIVEISAKALTLHERKLMIFTRPDSGDAAVGKNTGERVLIEDISPKKMPLVYASELAEQQIKHELRDQDQNVFKLGFVVDVGVSTKGGKPVAYSVTQLHQVIDLPDD